MIRTHIRIITIAAFAIILPGCAYWSGASPRDVATMTFYRVQGKVLVFVPVPCAASFPGKPAVIGEWVRRKNAGKVRVVCDVSCNCKVVVGK